MSDLQGLMPAAGKGVRARPYTAETHKGMLDINGTPNIQRIIGIMRDQLGIRKIVIVVGYLGDTIEAYFGDGSRFGVTIEYVENNELDKGLAWSICLAEQRISSEFFCVMLCDECYIDSNHYALLEHPYQENPVTCCGIPVDDSSLIQRNYAICLDADGGVARLEEKPKIIPSNIMGTGTFLCSRAIFSRLREAFANSDDGFVDFVSMLNSTHQVGKYLGYFQIEGTYVNINDRDSLYQAKYYERIRNFADNSFGLIVYFESGEENIEFTLRRYEELGVFDSISVLLPCDHKIGPALANTNASLIVCPDNIRLFGERLKYALDIATEDILVLAEADYSFPSRDVHKLLAYLPESDMVLGTRTTRQLIEQGSTMTGLVRLANAFLGRLIELLWWNRRARFTDVGCTFRAIWKTSFDGIKDDLTSKGPEFSAEMMIALLNQHQKVIEIPVNYFNRSQSLHEQYRTSSTFFRMLVLILARRLRP